MLKFTFEEMGPEPSYETLEVVQQPVPETDLASHDQDLTGAYIAGVLLGVVVVGTLVADKMDLKHRYWTWAQNRFDQDEQK